MFGEREIASYRSIKAPEQLREKVLSLEEKRIVPFVRYTKVYATAASIALLLGVSALWNWNRGEVQMNDQVYTAEYVTASWYARTPGEEGVTVELKAPVTRTLAVNHGILRSYDSKSGTLLAEGEKISVRGTVLLYWGAEEGVSNQNKDTDYRLYVKGWGKNVTYQMAYEQETDSWSIKEAGKTP